MIIKLLGADFSASNIGSIGVYTLTCNGKVVSITPNTILKNETGSQAATDLKTKILLQTNYAYAGITVKIGNTVLSTDDYFVETSDDASSVILNIAAFKIIDNITIDIDTTWVGEGEEETGYVEITDITGYAPYEGFISSTNTWNNLSGGKYSYIVVPVHGNTYVSISAGDQSVYIAGLRTHDRDNIVNGGTPDFSTDTSWNKRIVVGANTTKEFSGLPWDINYIWICTRYNNTSSMPGNVLIRTENTQNN